MGEAFAMPAPGRGDHAKIVGDGGMSWRDAKRVTVGGLRLIETSGLVVGDCVGNGLLEWVRHVSQP
jgi:hypothetical protein